MKRLSALCAAAALLLPAAAAAEVKVTLKDVHLCCGGCVKGVAAALKGIEGVKPACDRDAGTVTLTAADEAAARKALAALARAGYYGKSDSDKLAVPTPKGLPSGKVKTLTLAGFHNCCDACAEGITEAVQKVDGVERVTVTRRTLTATGNFDAAAVVKAMHDAGFSVRAGKK
ncbi:MAG TPA: heavy-metal-associated domain-containing protein [Gemmataceae bacterium]